MPNRDSSQKLCPEYDTKVGLARHFGTDPHELNCTTIKTPGLMSDCSLAVEDDDREQQDEYKFRSALSFNDSFLNVGELYRYASRIEKESSDPRNVEEEKAIENGNGKANHGTICLTWKVSIH